MMCGTNMECVLEDWVCKSNVGMFFNYVFLYRNEWLIMVRDVVNWFMQYGIIIGVF